MNQLSEIIEASPSRSLLGLDVVCFGYAEALAYADTMASMPFGQTVIAFMNANNANIMFEDAQYRDVLSRQVIFPDGVGLDIASTFVYGEAFPANLNGTDFVPALLTYMEQPRRIGLIGARRDIVERAAANFKSHAPWHEFLVVSDGYFDIANSKAIADRAASLDLDVLLVALGSPRQEKWIDRHIRPECAPLVISVGALFDFTAEAFPRAPGIVRKLRLEWAFRMLNEPRRLWKRYIIGNPIFLARALKQAFKVRVLGDA